MNLHEYQAKGLFARHGIPVPRSLTVALASEARAATDQLGGARWVVKAEVHALMSHLAQEGMGILMISSEMPEIIGMSDRVMVMWEGRSNGTLDIAEATQEKIMARATGLEIVEG